MNIIERFSSHLKEILTQSIQLATDLKNPAVEPPHLFFALLSQKGSVAAEILNRFKIDKKSLEQAVLALPVVKDHLHAPPAKSTAQMTITPFSPAAKMALEKAVLIAHENRHNHVGTEHLLAALMRAGDRHIEKILEHNGIKNVEVNKQLQAVLNNATQFPQIAEVTEAVDRIQESLSEAGPTADHEPLPPSPSNRRKETALNFFATDLTSAGIQQNIDPLIGRSDEVERVIQILCRKAKNNPVLLGDPGVGKTAVVEGLAKKILRGEVPDILLNKKIYALDMGLLIAGTIYRGEFEARLRQVMDEVARNPNIVLFIDEIHNIVGAGTTQGTMDAANILKPALARGQIRCVGATTPAEFKKYIESDAALERRFQPIYIKEPSVEQTRQILAGIKSGYERYHRVKITDEAVEAAVRLSHRYISNKFLPDKAIDLLDETAAAKRVAAKTPALDAKLQRLRQKLEATTLAKEAAATHDQFEEAVKLKEEEKKLCAEIKTVEQTMGRRKSKTLGTITARDVTQQITKITGTPPSELLLEEKGRLVELENELKKYVIGQDSVIGRVSEAVRHAQLELSSPDRPLTSFLFVGESGVGKTELAKTIAKILYPGQDALIKLDMSEYNESFGVSKLLGSPAGYVGYKDANQFTDRVKMNPYCVVLFDEIDKAHRDVAKLLLQILENGEIADSTGKKISFKHAIIILTTSWGAEEIKRGVLGFGASRKDAAETSKQLTEKLKERFSPELINRLDQICLFNPLNAEALIKIAELEIQRLNERLQQYGTIIKTDAEIISWLLKRAPEKSAGARDIRRYVRGEIENLISAIILQDKNKIKTNYQLKINQESLEIH